MWIRLKNGTLINLDFVGAILEDPDKEGEWFIHVAGGAVDIDMDELREIRAMLARNEWIEEPSYPKVQSHDEVSGIPPELDTEGA